MPVGGGKAWPDTPAPHQAPAVGRAPLEPEGLLIQAAVPVGGGKAWPGFEIDHSEPLGSRVAISRAGRRPRAHQAARPSKASPSTRSPATPLQLGAFEAEDVEELARTIR